MRRLLVSSRYVVIIAVAGAFVSALLALVYGALALVGLIAEGLTHHEFGVVAAKHLAIELIQLIDLFLLGIVLYIVALGLYELFIDPTLPTPGWLAIRTLDDLEERIIGVIVVLISVTFLSAIVEWDGGVNVLALGAAVGVVLLPLIYLLNSLRRGTDAGEAHRVE
jgi:uncharacterized membrane protein YqhA